MRYDAMCCDPVLIASVFRTLNHDSKVLILLLPDFDSVGLCLWLETTGTTRRSRGILVMEICRVIEILVAGVMDDRLRVIGTAAREEVEVGVLIGVRRGDETVDGKLEVQHGSSTGEELEDLEFCAVEEFGVLGGRISSSCGEGLER